MSPVQTPDRPATDQRVLWATAITLVAVYVVLTWLQRVPAVTTQNDDAVYILLSREVASLSYDQPWLFGPPIHSLYPLGYPTWLALLRLTLANVDTVDDGVEKVRLRSRFGTLSALLTQQTGHPVVHGRRIREVLDAGQFDVVNFHHVSLIDGPGLLSYGSTAIRLYMAHEHWLGCPTYVLWRHTGLLQRQLDEIDTIIAMNEFSRDKHHECGFPKPMEILPYFAGGSR